MTAATQVPWRIQDPPAEGPEPDFPDAAECPPGGAIATEIEPSLPSTSGDLVPVMERPGEPGPSPGITVRIADVDPGSWFG